MVTVPVMMVLIAALLLLLFRRVHGVLVPGLAAAIPTLCVFGVMGVFGEPIGILNQSYATLLPAIVIADAIHLVSRFHEEARRNAAPGQRLSHEQRRAAIVRASGRIGLACLLTTATTGIGFCSLHMANMPVLRSFGLYAALGIVLAYATVLMVIPLLLSFTRGAVPGQDHPISAEIDKILRSCARISTRRPWPVLGGTLLIVMGCLLLSGRVVIDNALTGLLRDDHPTTVANNVVDSHLGGLLGIEVETVGEPGAHKDPRVLNALAGLEDWASDQAEVRSIQGPASMLRLFALAQNDIKKILAYSTISQLGYMFAGVATTVFFAGVFHLVTHAFFKALLFLGAGAVIHSLEGEQDIRKMGGLRKDMFWVFVLFTVGSLALAGLPGLAGFFSKDEILASVLLLAHYQGGMWGVTWWLLVFTAALTAFYTMRMLILTFFGPPADPHRHPHAVHWTMMSALGLLAVLSFFGGYALLKIDVISLEHFTEPAWSHGIAHTLHETAPHDHYDAHWVALLYSVGAVTLGVVSAILVYGFARPQLRTFATGPGAQLHWLLENKFFVDEAYDALFVRPVTQGATKLWEQVDRLWIDGRMVEGPAKVTWWASGWIRKAQPGVVNAATSAVAAGSLVVLAYLFVSGVLGG